MYTRPHHGAEPICPNPLCSSCTVNSSAAVQQVQAAIGQAEAAEQAQAAVERTCTVNSASSAAPSARAAATVRIAESGDS